MASAMVISLLLASTVFLMYVNTAAQSSAPPPPGQEGCSNELISFSPCLPYVSAPPNNFTSTAPSKCCDAFASATDAGAENCLCYLLKQPMVLGFPLNESRVLSLPLVCSLRNASLATTESLDSLCSSAALPPLGNRTDTNFSPPNPGSGDVTSSTGLPSEPNLPPETVISSPALPNPIEEPPMDSSATEWIHNSNDCLLPGVVGFFVISHSALLLLR
ncbi:non-specific lipid-transfer protein-like protein [Tripterygium wilfordii]|uniref:Non-specific lipid-transfer protein-like protein n=1 Tax=Tripterygium wilfordii TaxID=458696 RepID=A0A7J7CRY2_TRIWF|nr:non-specific lipid transfer protein GPI-anchored 25 [Tripterygium wilfordii]KAF5736882.1 non-specific lipid-transfer protein-like protein [Tripterygium wilfordii]